jgi:hypothetical protein
LHNMLRPGFKGIPHMGSLFFFSLYGERGGAGGKTASKSILRGVNQA